MKKIVIIIMAVALVALPTMAEIEGWRSTSVLQGASGTYQAPITEVGAVGVQEMAATTDDYSPAQAPGVRKSFDNTSNPGKGNPGSPIGDALIPLMLCACAYLIIRARKRASKGERANS